MEKRLYWQPEIETAPREKLRQMQLEKLKATVSRAYQKTAFYRRKFDEVGIKPEDINSLEDVTKLPLTRYLEDFVATPVEDKLAIPWEEVIIIESTSGSISGAPQIVVFSEKDIQGWADIFSRFATMHGIGEGDVFQFMFAMTFLTSGYQRMGAKVIPGDWATSILDNQVKLIAKAGTTALFSTPGYFLYLINRAKELSIDLKQTKLRIVEIGGEPWPESFRQRMEAELGITFREIYGLIETGDFGGECSARSGLHIFDDMQLVEIVDPESDKILPYGEIGEIVTTPLWLDAMPLVRYRTGDVARFLPYEVCSCGRTFQRISRVKGRVDHIINVKGVKLLPFDVDEVVQSIPEFQGEFQITVENPGILDKLKVKAESKTGAERHGELKQRLEAELTKALSVPTEVEVIPTGSLVRPGIKAQRIVRTYKK